MLQESKSEVTPAMQDQVKSLVKTDKPDKESDSEEKANSDTEPNDLYYYNKQEKTYKVFDPETSKWSSYPEKPTAEFLEKLQSSNVH